MSSSSVSTFFFTSRPSSRRSFHRSSSAVFYISAFSSSRIGLLSCFSLRYRGEFFVRLRCVFLCSFHWTAFFSLEGCLLLGIFLFAWACHYCWACSPVSRCFRARSILESPALSGSAMPLPPAAVTLPASDRVGRRSPIGIPFPWRNVP